MSVRIVPFVTLVLTVTVRRIRSGGSVICVCWVSVATGRQPDHDGPFAMRRYGQSAALKLSDFSAECWPTPCLCDLPNTFSMEPTCRDAVSSACS